MIFRRECVTQFAATTVSPDEREVLLGCGTRFDLERGHFLGTMRVVGTMQLLDGGRVVHIGEGGSLDIVRADDPATPLVSRPIVGPGATDIASLAPDGQSILTMHFDRDGESGAPESYRLPSLDPIPLPFSHAAHIAGVLGLAADGSAWVFRRSLVHLARDGSERNVGPELESVRDAAMSRNGAWVLIQDGLWTLRVFDATSGESVSEVALPPIESPDREDFVGALAISDDANRIAWVGGSQLHVVARDADGAWSQIATVPMGDEQSSLTFIDHGHALVGGEPMVLVREGGSAPAMRPRRYEPHVPRGYRVQDTDEANQADGLVARYEPTREGSSTLITVSAHDHDEFDPLPDDPEQWALRVASRFYPQADLSTAERRHEAALGVERDPSGGHVASLHLDIGDCGSMDYDVTFHERDGVLYQIEIMSDALRAHTLARLQRAFAIDPFAEPSQPETSRPAAPRRRARTRQRR